MGALGVTMAHAGTDTTFTSSVTNLTTWTQGSLGKLAAVASLGVGVVGAILRFDWKLIAGGVGIGLAAVLGPRGGHHRDHVRAQTVQVLRRNPDGSGDDQAHARSSQGSARAWRAS